MTRLLAAGVTAVCVLMALVMASGAWLALSLSEWGTLALAVLGMLLMLAVGGFSLHLARRQGQILEAGEALLELTDPQQPPAQ